MSAVVQTQTTDTDDMEFVQDDSTALYIMQAWILKLRQHGLISVSSENIISLTGKAAQRFYLGIKSGQPYLGVQDFELTWLSRMPWSHAAMYKGNPHIYLVSDALSIDGDEIQPFALDIHVDSDLILSKLESQMMIGVREVQSTNGTVTAIAATPFVELHVVLMDPGQRVMDSESKPSTKMRMK